jgi:hypothetical protein
MSRNNWQWDNRWAWKPFNRKSFFYGIKQEKRSAANYRRSELRGKLVGFFWGILWCLQMVLLFIAVSIILSDHDIVVTRAVTIAR